MIKFNPFTGNLDLGGGSGTVTTVSVASANGVSGTVANATTTPAITLALGAITPSSVNVSGLTFSQLVATDGSDNLVSLAVATYPSLTELSYVKGVTSAIQTQITGKAATNQTMNIGTTAVAINRASAALVLTGITSIDGNAATVTVPAALGASTATTQTPADNSTKIATTAYVDNAVLGQNYKQACKYATTTVLPTVVYYNGVGNDGIGATITGFAVGALGVDSASPAVADRILVKNQADNKQNGIYVVTATGSGIAVFVMTRATDFDMTTDIKTGDSVFVTTGTVNASTTWAYNGVTSPAIGTDAITFTQTAGVGTLSSGNGITITGASIAIDTSVTVDKTTTQTLTNKTIDGVTPTVMGYVDPTSSIQTQLNAKGVGTWTDSSTSTGSNKTFVAPALGAATATSINGYPINATPTANNIPVLDANALLPQAAIPTQFLVDQILT